MDSTKQKVSYCIGLETGRNLKQQFKDMDYSLLLEGFQDAVSDNQPKLNPDEVHSIMTTLRQQIEVQQRQFIAKVAAENKKAGEAFLEENKQKEGVIALPSGLQYQVLQSGNGPSPTILDTVTTHYRGSYINGQIFDSSYERGKPAVFPLNRVIQGWAEALQQMKVGDKWKIFIPSYLAYGEMGFGNEIGPNVTLVFEMELLAINE